MLGLAPSAPLTDEDENIWLRVQLRARVVPFQLPARAADRRDYTLIYRYEAAKAYYVARWGMAEYTAARFETVRGLAAWEYSP